jgi:hypothetical protein
MCYEIDKILINKYIYNILREISLFRSLRIKWKPGLNKRNLALASITNLCFLHYGSRHGHVHDNSRIRILIYPFHNKYNRIEYLLRASRSYACKRLKASSGYWPGIRADKLEIILRKASGQG